jgi:hypothetical protein
MAPGSGDAGVAVRLAWEKSALGNIEQIAAAAANIGFT